MFSFSEYFLKSNILNLSEFIGVYFAWRYMVYLQKKFVNLQISLTLMLGLQGDTEV